MLEFRRCRKCGESHAIRRDGRMSIHVDVDGNRCEEPAKPKRQSVGISDRERKRERDQAFGAANSRKVPRPAKPLDRTIYAVGGVHTVSGGLPSRGKRR